ncbi:hr1-like Rho-binding repeat protein [Grosmannia clavigera kw1407]|uniref:Hr1-like Rho-binding repeat protein n=1 Tax=Grosmannia clavigera (strain kw1407 / UAMH 11150) TaxID=655863 RepID=F0XIW7_GROCL|nr:hr1-like Rho-binding repeat protein [Grosmannia clavigera kw1407]EFX02311.1 hr1-like Rho-binding repeat protein [Grosmannia clavigera kw1407]
MAGRSTMLGASATPTQKFFSSQPGATPSNHQTKNSLDRDGLQPPAAATNAGTFASGRSIATSGVAFAPRGSSLNPSPAPGSFVSDLRNQMGPLRAGSRVDVYNSEKTTTEAEDDEEEDDDDSKAAARRSLAALRDLLNRELKIKEGSENMLEALNSKKAKQTKDQRQRVEAELNSSNLRIKELRQRISDTQRPRPVLHIPTRARIDPATLTTGLRSPQNTSRSGAGSDVEDQTESPTFALAEILQALEVDGFAPEYYVTRANSLVDLFKRHPTLKYDLVWSVFGLRIQVMLLSDSREIVAAAYRMTRYAISDVSSLRKIRALNTDYLVVLSLIKDRKADVEREQALKFIRTFLDVKEGVHELSRAVVRTIAAVAEHAEDRLRPICLETLAEILVRDPRLLVASGGLASLSDALAEGAYKAPESLTSAILFLLDAPQRRKYLRAGYELEVLFTTFTDQFLSNEAVLKQNAKAIASALKTWSGLMNLSMYDFRAVRSLVASLSLPSAAIRDTVIELIYSLFRIKSPAWATSFLAGRRLTTYGRVATLRATPLKDYTVSYSDEEGSEQNFVEHYTALLLAVFIKSGLLPRLLHLTQETDNLLLRRKSTLLIGEILRLSSRLLPPSWSDEVQLLPDLFAAATRFQDESHFIATGTVYQMSSVSKTLYRSAPSYWASGSSVANSGIDFTLLDEQPKSGASMVFDEATFRQLLLESGVLSSSNFLKWNWDVVLRVIEGPLTNGKRLEEAIRASKFVKRIMSFYRPFKFRFSDIKTTKGTQKYVRTSGITAQYPMFAKDRLVDTLCGGYLPMIGVLSSDPRGLQMMERWRMFNMMYHIVDLKQRPDLIKLLLSHFDYTVNGHQRVLLSKSLTAGTKDIRIHATNVLRKYAVRTSSTTSTSHGVGDSKWAIRLLVTQLYDPEVEVCATAIKILEKACYHYLDGLDYISNEMDDWILGRNDAYVGLIEASLARAFVDSDEQPSRIISFADEVDADTDAHIPPHFYRELTRTEEGCRLLREKGHFDEFAATIRDCGMQSEDGEVTTKVKGCLWAVGNVGAMELGAPFLESCDVVEQIIKIACRHEIMSLRGTAFFVLGLISRSLHGMEILSEFGWDSNTSVLGTSLGFCIPLDLSQLFSLAPWQHAAVTTIQLPDSQKTERLELPVMPVRPRLGSLQGIEELDGDRDQASSKKYSVDLDPVIRRILELVVDLGNMVISKRAAGELLQIRQRESSAFEQPLLFRRVLSILECHHYRLPVRRMVLELFSRGAVRSVVFGEDESEDDDDTGGGSDADSGFPDCIFIHRHAGMPRGRVLIIAGSDSSGGAGLEADQKVIAAHGCYAMTATTALTAQNTLGVYDIHPVPQAFLKKQIDACFDDIGVDVVKTELKMLMGCEEARLDSVDDLEHLARQAREKLGSEWVLAKGGHIPFREDYTIAMTQKDRDVVVNILVGPDDQVFRIVSKYQDSRNTHGTGCSLASAIASNLSIGMEVFPAVKAACRYVEIAIQTAPGYGHGHGPLNHFHCMQTLPFSRGYFFDYVLERHDIAGVHFSRANALAAYKSKNAKDIARSVAVIQQLEKEMSSHVQFCSKFGITREDMKQVEEHTDVGQSEDWFALQIALAPCIIGYGAAARALLEDKESTKQEGNPYWSWVETYTSENHDASIKTTRDGNSILGNV